MNCPNDVPHVSVMPNEVMELLDLPRGGIAVDGTLGMAGHACRMAQVLGAEGHLIGIDRDSASLALAAKRLSGSGLRVDLLKGNYRDIDLHLAKVKEDAVDGILLDLGISSFQLDDASRGFAFKEDGPLDMRMDTSASLTAEEIVNTWPEEKLAKIIDEYGEDRFAKRIAKAIVFNRTKERISSTKALADIVLRALPHGYTRGRIHPATRTFQALRIVVNDELVGLSESLQKCLNALKPGGRLCVISFHSLEDRIVKHQFKRWADEGLADVLTKKPMQANEEEVESNSRSRSAKLRAIKRVI